MRQDSLRWLSALFACLVALTLPGVATAAVVWTATFEKGDLSEWQAGVNGTKGTRKNVEVLGEQVHTGMFAGKITVHPDDTFTFGQNRVDIQHPSTLTGEGKHSWLSGYYMMPADAKVRNEFGFYESNGSFQNVMDFWVAPKTGGGTTINFGVGFLGATKLWTGDFSAGVWHQVAIHVLWSMSAQTGSVDVWFDGSQVVTAAKAKTKADANTLFYQTGLHRGAVANFVETIYIDDFIEADNFADAKIGPPTGPRDGGVGSDASGGGTDGGGASGAGGSGATGAAGAMNAGGAAGVGGATGASGATSAGGATGAGTGSATSGTGTAGAATTGPGGGTGGTASGAAGSSKANPDDSLNSGCSCTVFAARDRSASWAGALLLLGAATAARRRRRPE
jgi:MYXO-CTERM domain-containing protein